MKLGNRLVIGFYTQVKVVTKYHAPRSTALGLRVEAAHSYQDKRGVESCKVSSIDRLLRKRCRGLTRRMML